MNDVPHVRFVDPHAECDGRDNRVQLIVDQRLLVPLAVRVGHAGMIGARAEPQLIQQRADFFHPVPGDGIHDSGLAPEPLHHGTDLIQAGQTLLDVIGQIGTMEIAHQQGGIGHIQGSQNIAAHLFRGRRGETMQRHAGKTLLQHSQLPVFGPEVMSPLADTVRFVDRDKCRTMGVE